MSAFPKPRQIDYLEALKDMNMEEDIFLTLLTKVIGESKYVQNNPRGGLIPEEGKVAKHIFCVQSGNSIMWPGSDRGRLSES